jgi:hypothetical protein
VTNSSSVPAQEPSPYYTTVLAKNPVGYWRLGESAVPTAYDETQNGHNGSYFGGVTFLEPGALANDSNTAVGLDGQNAYVEVPDSEQFSQTSSGTGMTVEVWMRPDLLVFDGQTDEHYIHWLGKGGPGRYEWGLRFYSTDSPRPNRISAYIWNSDGKLGAGAYFEDPIQSGEWIHVVACYAPGDLNTPNAGVSIYKNGLLRGSPDTQQGALYSSYNILPAHSTAPLRFGTRDLGSFLDGGLDEIAIYPRVLTADEIAENYQVGSGKTNSEPTPVE